MAVYERAYRGYAGPQAQPWSRFAVVSRYALRDVFSSRFFLAFFVACLVWPLACAVVIYLHYNLEALSILDLSALELIKIDRAFFRMAFLIPQNLMAFLMILIVGPALISPDLRNNALPLILSRPLNKTDYVLGKFLVLALLTSSITWIPGLSLFALQSYLAGFTWMTEHLRLAFALFVGSWVWIAALSSFALAISAWVKWKPWARIVFLGFTFIMSAVGQVFSLVFEVPMGRVLSIFDVADRIWDSLFGVEQSSIDLPAPLAWAAMILFTLLSVGILYRRLRAFEVVS